MKNVFSHPEPTRAELTGPRYWRSVGELTDTPEFREYLQREFPEGASEMNDVDRRHFLKIMAASFAFGGMSMTGCRRPEAKILAYAKTPENVIPGLPLFFATAFPRRRSAIPVVVETHEGRPTKIEGNPSYAPNGGTTDLAAQASILDLYDPDRSTAHTKGGAGVTLAAVHDLLAGVIRNHVATGGTGLAFLAEQSSSPTRRRLVRALKKQLPQATWAEYEPVDQTAPERAATALVGRPAKPHYDFRQATRILAVDADFIGVEDGHVQFSRDFAAGRRRTGSVEEMNRLYAVESTMTLAGAMADHRKRLASGQMTGFLAQMALALGVAGQPALARLAASAPVESAWVEVCAADLKAAGPRAFVIAGSHLPEAAHAIALLINQALGSLGHTVTLLETEADEASGIDDLAARIRSGAVKSLFILGGNPVYNAPVDLDWTKLQGMVPEVVRLGYHADETSAAAHWHISATHYLEAWGDARTPDGTIVPVQPMIMPLFNGLTEIELLARILGEAAPDPYSQVLATFAGWTRGDPEKTFREFLHEGVLADSAYAKLAAAPNAGAMARLLEAATVGEAPFRDRLEVRFAPDLKIDDGRFNNNGWLQECPDPISKLTWDNAVIISPRLADELGVSASDPALAIIRQNPNTFDTGKEIARRVRVTLNGRSVEGPVHIQPGLDSYTVLLPLGFGRTHTGRIGKGAGFSAYAIREGGAAIASGATIEVIEGKTTSLANTQEHWSMEGRAIVREANLEEFEQNPHFVDHIGMESHTPPVFGEGGAAIPLSERSSTTPRGNSLYEHPDLDGVHQWGMTIDLNTCTGCNACVVACQAENNIPIVGRDQVRRGREMHWIRIDRYYADGNIEAGLFGGPKNLEPIEDPQVVVQPVGCLHCETAPCETVCPVNATVHDEEGLNVMAYNRCVGTRYCANNCPYKVRRFNFFDYNQRQLDSLYLGPLAPKGMPDLLQMAKNPNVTVRMRGVMEKCTYCVQRIQAAKIQQKVKARGSSDVTIPDGTFKVACQQACPSESIAFGNIKDPHSAVSKTKADPRDYSLLGYLNTRPRTTYLARLRNPNPDMPDFANLPLSRREYDIKSGHGGGSHDAHGESTGHAEPAATTHDEPGGSH